MAHFFMASAHVRQNFVRVICIDCGVLSTRLLPLLPALLLTSASAVSLNVAARTSVPGAGGLSALTSAPDNSGLLCQGSNWLQFDSAGKFVRSVALGAPCTGLSVSPSGRRLLTTTESGVTVWNLADGSKVADLPLPNAKNRVGFVSDDELLTSSGTGLDRLTISTGARQTVRQGAVNALFVAPDAQRAVISDGQKVQLVRLADFSVLSGLRCETACTAQNANFSADGRTAVVHDGEFLVGLREGVPASTVLHHVQAAAGLPQPNNTVLTFAGGNVESHDLQTGRRESVLQAGGVLPLARQTAAGRVLALSESGELLSGDLAFKNVGRFPLPAVPTAGGLDASGAVYTLSGGTLTLNGKKIAGTYWDVQTMNKTTWALATGKDGGLQVGTLSGEKFTALNGPRTATHLSVNFWGNTAALWDDETLWIVSQAKNKVVSTFKLGGKAAWVTLSPDATRAYVYPGKLREAEPDVVTLATGKRSPLPDAYRPAGGFINDIELSGNGMGLMIGSRDNLSVIDPKKREVFNGARENVGALARFSPDSKWLAYFRRDQSGTSPVLVLLNLETGKEEATGPALSNLPTFLAWSADSKKLAVGASLAGELGSAVTFEVR